MAEVSVREPAWLTARRERAVAVRDGLDLPRFKGAAGWEFTELGQFALDSFTAAAPGEGDASAVERTQALLDAPDGAVAAAAAALSVTAPVASAAEAFYGITLNDQLVTFQSDSPLAVRTSVRLTGLASKETAGAARVPSANGQPVASEAASEWSETTAASSPVVAPARTLVITAIMPATV